MTEHDEKEAPPGAQRSVGSAVNPLSEFPASARDFVSAAELAGAGGARWRRIIDRAALRHGILVADLLGRSRQRRFVTARYEAIRIIAFVFPAMSSTRIGEIFDRDHTTVLRALGATADSPYAPIEGRNDTRGRRAT